MLRFKVWITYEGVKLPKTLGKRTIFDRAACCKGDFSIAFIEKPRQSSSPAQAWLKIWVVLWSSTDGESESIAAV